MCSFCWVLVQFGYNKLPRKFFNDRQTDATVEQCFLMKIVYFCLVCAVSYTFHILLFFKISCIIFSILNIQEFVLYCKKVKKKKKKKDNQEYGCIQYADDLYILAKISLMISIKSKLCSHLIAHHAVSTYICEKIVLQYPLNINAYNEQMSTALHRTDFLLFYFLSNYSLMKLSSEKRVQDKDHV